MLSLEIHLYIKTKMRNTKIKTRCTRWRIFFLRASSMFWFRLMPSISMQNEAVSAVMAPSELGNKAEINAMMNITEIIFGI